MISIVAAVAKNGVIGKNNLMPWHIPEELKLFRELTEGKPLIVGRRTFESLPNLLENRLLIVLSRNPDFATGTDAARVARSIPEALRLAQSRHSGQLAPGLIRGAGIQKAWIPHPARGEARQRRQVRDDKQHEPEILVAGGENVYQQLLPQADRLYISHIKKPYEGDAFFPAVRYSEWTPTASQKHQAFSFVTYERAQIRTNA